mgnify:CR=1 FL=1
MGWLLVVIIVSVIILIILALLEEWKLALWVFVSSFVIEGLAYISLSRGPVALGLTLWSLFVIIPPILGLLRKVRFHWVILWELVMFSPILILFSLGKGGGYRRVR